MSTSPLHRFTESGPTGIGSRRSFMEVPNASMGSLIELYFKLQEAIHEYFGYREDWKVIPMSDETDQHWFVKQDKDGRGFYCHSSKPFTEETVTAGAEIYGGTIYTQRFLPKWVYRGEDYTMVCADTHTDGNKFLMLFSNDKECTDQKLIDLYKDKWAIF